MPITIAEVLQLTYDLVRRAEQAEARVQALTDALTDAQKRLAVIHQEEPVDYQRSQDHETKDGQ